MIGFRVTCSWLFFFPPPLHLSSLSIVPFSFSLQPLPIWRSKIQHTLLRARLHSIVLNHLEPVDHTVCLLLILIFTYDHSLTMTNNLYHWNIDIFLFCLPLYCFLYFDKKFFFLYILKVTKLIALPSPYDVVSIFFVIWLLICKGENILN